MFVFLIYPNALIPLIIPFCNSSIGRFFGPPLRWRWKMAALPLPAAILDDLICGTGNEVIQDGERKRKGRHFPPPPQWGSKKPPQVFDFPPPPQWGSKSSPQVLVDVIIVGFTQKSGPDPNWVTSKWVWHFRELRRTGASLIAGFG